MTSRDPYSSNLEHLMDELRRLDLLLGAAVNEFRSARNGDSQTTFSGLHISDDEIDRLTKSPGGSCRMREPSLQEASEAIRLEIQERVEKTEQGDVLLRLPHLCSVFDLSSFETDVLLAALAPEIDRKYEKIFAYLQDDVSRKQISVDLALNLFCEHLAERITARKVFAEAAPLIAHSLVHLREEPSEQPVPLLARYLKLDDRIAEFLLGSDQLDRGLIAAVETTRCLAPQYGLDDLLISQELRTALERVVCLVSDRPTVFLMHGPVGAGKKAAAQAVCRPSGRPLIVVDLPATLNSDASFQGLLRSAFREAKLYGGLIYLDRWEVLIGDDAVSRNAMRAAEQEMRRFPGLVFLGSPSSWRPESDAGFDFLNLEFPAPDETLRRRLWEIELDHQVAGVDVDLGYLAGAFRLTGARIRNAIEHSQGRSLLQHGPDHKLTTEDLVTGCRLESRRHLIAFSKRITPRRTWSDLVMPKDSLAHLREFCHQVRCRGEVYGSWGFGQKLSLGKGVIALFTGPSGTGKTLSSEILAKELGLDLYKVDLSCVVSKYIGETEKNLSRVFQDAETSNAILFFDEADALFGKRSEVKDAHDRYANIEINYLLQQVEEYEGVVILATNMSKNIDSAFLRRMQFRIEFPFPDEIHRAHIWRGIFPPQAPLAEDVDFDFLSRKFKIAGGNIKNVAVAAAFRAAADGGTICMEHLILALKREYQKLGRVCERGEFAEYYDLVR